MEGRVKHLLIPAIIFFCCCLHASHSKREKGGWGKWGPVSACSKTCGMGLRTRIRSWETAPGEPALEVPFTNTEQFTCFVKDCPQNGTWSEWGIWGECSAPCNGGTRKRHRDCNNPPPANGGKDCEGEKFDEEQCNERKCPRTPKDFDLSKCKKGRMFMCDNKAMCVKKRLKCDGEVQCSDGSDEVGCWRSYGQSIGRVRFNSASHRPVSDIAAIVALLTSAWFTRLLTLAL